MLQLKVSWDRKRIGRIINAANNAMTKMYTMPYLMTIPRRCRFCLMEYNGGRICLDGRNQNSMVACRRSTYGIRRGGVSINKRMWHSKKSEVHRPSSIILTTNSRAGCDMACAPRPMPHHLPVHHARLDSSCLNSLERNTAMTTL